MQVTLNLDTPEKRALFLLLTDNPTAIVDAVIERISKQGMSNIKERLNNVSIDGLYRLQADIFSQEDWEEVYDLM